ncbi:hypothetical protein CES86_0634 [Brucella lupini]|uniref:Uncharacterized protein n=1 Tax=Brucella lupini TaxID=255457 RepID=A0A256GXN0_9HYPH|nr:hypothetical protein CES86_0634 [Brucella lupini]
MDTDQAAQRVPVDRPRTARKDLRTRQRLCGGDKLTRIQGIGPNGEVRGQTFTQEIDQTLGPDRQLRRSGGWISVRILRRGGRGGCCPHRLGIAHRPHVLLVQERKILRLIAQSDAESSPLPIQGRDEVANVVHLPRFDMQPQIQRRQRAHPGVNDEVYDFLSVSGSDPRLAQGNDRGPMTQREIVHLERAAARRQEAP